VDQTTISEDFPDTLLGHQGFKANGSIHFGPDGFLYATIGNYDSTTPLETGGKPFTQDLSSPIGKVLRINKNDGSGPPDNPSSGQPGTDARVFAYGFARASDFALHPQSGRIYATDSTDSCEELNVITAGGNYGGLPVGQFPYQDCSGGQQVVAIYFLAVEGKKPGDFESYVDVSGLAFTSAQTSPRLGDSLLVCEADTGQMRRLVLASPDYTKVTSDDALTNDCSRSVLAGPGGTVYYSNDQEIRRLVAVQSPHP
jgi:glucose/arabinose dehydrogenase